MDPTVNSVLNFSSIIEQKWKNSDDGTQSSSRMIASSTCSKSQSRPETTLVLQPRFFSEKLVNRSQSQSTFEAISLVLFTNSRSSEWALRGPSAIRKSFCGRTFLISKNTRSVSFGRLKMIKAMGVGKPLFNWRNSPQNQLGICTFAINRSSL